MADLSENLARFIRSQSDYSNTIEKLQTYGVLANDTVTNGIDLESDIYKYEYPLPLIRSTANYDVLKILGIENSQTLLQNTLDINLISKKNKYDKYSENISTLTRDLYSHYICYNNVDDMTKLDLFLSFTKNKKNKNYYSFLFGNNFDTPISSTSYIFLYLLYMDIARNVKVCTNFSDELHDFILDNDVVGTSALKLDFTTYIAENKFDITKDIVKIYLKNVYKYVMVDSAVIIDIAGDVVSTVDDISTVFTNFVDKRLVDPLFHISNDLITLTCNSIGADFIQTIYNNSTYVNTEFVEDIMTYENNTYVDFKSKVNYRGIKNYMFLLYCYKEYPLKFLNILSPTIKSFVEDLVKPIDTYAFNHRVFKNKVNYLLDNSFNYSDIADYLNNTIDATYLQTIIDDNSIDKFACFRYLSRIIELFITSYSEFDDYIESVLESIHTALKSRGLVEDSFNWYQNPNLLRLYFKSYFKTKIYHDLMFIVFVGNFHSYVESTLSTMIVSNTFSEVQLYDNFRYSVNANTDNIFIFLENIFLSTLTKDIIYDNLSYYLR